MSRKQDKPLPAPPPPHRDLPPPPPPDRPLPILPEARHSWVPGSFLLSSPLSFSTGKLSDSYLPPESRCAKDANTADSHRALDPFQLRPARLPHINGRPLSCPPENFGRLNQRLEGAGKSECPKVRLRSNASFSKWEPCISIKFSKALESEKFCVKLT